MCHLRSVVDSERVSRKSVFIKGQDAPVRELGFLYVYTDRAGKCTLSNYFTTADVNFDDVRSYICYESDSKCCLLKVREAQGDEVIAWGPINPDPFISQSFFVISFGPPEFDFQGKSKPK